MAKEFRKSDSKKLIETARLLDMSPSQLAAKLGYSNGSGSHWAQSGSMPYVAALACDALLAERTAPDRFILVSMRQGKPIESRVFNGLDSIQLNGKTYLLLPTGEVK